MRTDLGYAESIHCSRIVCSTLRRVASDADSERRCAIGTTHWIQEAGATGAPNMVERLYLTYAALISTALISLTCDASATMAVGCRRLLS